MITIENITANVVQIEVPETLQTDDFLQLAPKVDTLIRKHGKVRLLLDASKFNGWENIAAFDKHMGFVKSHHNNIERVALVAGHAWQHWVAGALKMFVHPEIRVFDKICDARNWITEGVVI